MDGGDVHPPHPSFFRGFLCYLSRYVYFIRNPVRECKVSFRLSSAFFTGYNLRNSSRNETIPHLNIFYPSNFLNLTPFYIL